MELFPSFLFTWQNDMGRCCPTSVRPAPRERVSKRCDVCETDANTTTTTTQGNDDGHYRVGAFGCMGQRGNGGNDDSSTKQTGWMSIVS